ncbi:hypothetical protein [Pontibacillus yanchengensis]|nr:hypothetical protein [Pontibacillus yanchengensis]
MLFMIIFTFILLCLIVGYGQHEKIKEDKELKELLKGDEKDE